MTFETPQARLLIIEVNQDGLLQVATKDENGVTIMALVDPRVNKIVLTGYGPHGIYKMDPDNLIQ